MDEPVIQLRSQKPLEQVRADLERACQAHGFGVVGALDLRAKLDSKGVPLGFGCQVVDVCNPHQAKRVLDLDPRVSAVLPCRLSLFEDPEGGTTLAMVSPARLIPLFGVEGLGEVASEVEATLLTILREAAD